MKTPEQMARDLFSWLGRDGIDLGDPQAWPAGEVTEPANLLTAWLREAVLAEREASAERAQAAVRHHYGWDGAVVADRTGITEIPSPRVEAVDTTGAGDAFTGALSLRLARGDDLATAARFAARVGAAAVRKPGAQSSFPALTDL